jgi:hypothetical protein
VDIFFVWRSFSVYKSIGDYIIDGMSDRTIIIDVREQNFLPT